MPVAAPPDPRRALVGLLVASRGGCVDERDPLYAATLALADDLAASRELAVTALIDIARRILEFVPMADAVLQVVAEDLATAEPLPARVPIQRTDSR